MNSKKLKLISRPEKQLRLGNPARELEKSNLDTIFWRNTKNEGEYGKLW